MHVKGKRGLLRLDDVLHFSCDSGYQLSGSSIMRCDKDGNWSTELPLCIQINCTEPPSVPNAVRLGAEAKVFPAGTEVQYNCSMGYYLEGRNYVKCRDTGTWESYRPSCIRVTCPEPVSIPHGYYKEENTIPTPIYEYQATVLYLCEKGYNMVGDASLECLASGSWNSSTPSCEPILCPSTESISNGDIEGDSRMYGSKLVYRCHIGYKIAGDNQRECQIDGQWSGNIPACEQIICPSPLKPEYGFVEGQDFTFDNILRYRCEPGYSLVGNRERRCTKDRKWSGQQPKCVPVECPAPNVLENGHVVGSNFEYQGTIEYTCEAGYRLEGLKIRRCIENATWSGSAPICDRVVCQPPKLLKHGDINSVQHVYLPGSVIHYSCEVGYEMDGKGSRTCREDGSWTGYTPECKNIRCNKPKLVKHGKYNALDKAFMYGAIAVYACDQGFQLDGPVRRMCSEDKTWSGTEPSCVHIECPKLQLISNGTIDVMAHVKAGELVTYKCEPGFELKGESVRHCSMNGTWDGHAPYCEHIECDKPADVISNGRMISLIFSYGSTIDYVCDPGYEAEGLTNRTCLASGEWDSPIPVCERVPCPKPLNPVNGKIEGFDFRYQKEVVYYCNKGYKLQGTGRRRCTAAKIWDSESPVCVRIECPSPRNISNGEILMDSFPPKYKDKVMYSCNEGFELNGTTEISCTSDGTWSENPPVCHKIKCKQPQEIADGSFVRAVYEFGDTVKYSCNPGFVLDSNELTCTVNGTYEGSAPACNRISCPQPDEIENGQPVTNGTRFEDFVIYRCYRGYELIGESTRVCNEHGSWTGEKPQCKIVTCTNPVHIPDSIAVTKEGYNYGEVINIICHQGYELRGTDEYFCQANGEWSKFEAECVKIACPLLEVRNSLVNGSRSSGGEVQEYDYGAILEVTCENGYNIDGASTVMCTANRTWDPSPPTCKPVKCPKLDIDNSVAVDDEDSMVYGKNFTVQCVKGYRMTGRDVVTCTENGTWYPDKPMCILVTCAQPVFSRSTGNIIIIKSPNKGVGYPYGITLKFDCNRGFEMRGNDIITCLDNGQWSNENPTCIPIQCPMPDISPIRNLKAVNNKDWYDIGDKLTLDCDYGYELDGISEMECEEEAKWSSGLNVICKQILCDAPQMQESLSSNNPGLFRRKYTVGNTINYKCNRGWIIEGSSRSECLANRSWTSPPPTCKMITCPTLNVSNADVIKRDTSTMKMAVDTDIHISCHEGYLIVGKTNLHCLENGTWDFEAPYCQKVQCEIPSIQHARIKATSREFKFYFGDPLYVDCLSGYELHGAAELFCRSDGTWSATLPVCNIVNCSFPDIQNGYIINQPQVVSYGQTVRAKCDMGYTMKGNDELTCTADGSWSDDIPVCGMVFCLTPHIEHGMIYALNEVLSLQELPFNQTITITCSLGYELKGNSRLTCLHHGYWSYASPICNRLRCADPVITHGIVMGSRVQVQEGYGFGDSAKFSCEDGFKLLGRDEIICFPNGTWSAKFPECRVLSCAPEPSMITNAEIFSYPPITDNNYTYATRVQIMCKPGFRLIGDAEIACGPSGNWSGIMPVCHRMQCRNPSIPNADALGMYPNQTSQTSPFGYGDVVTFSCHPGFERHGMPVLGCREDGTWNASFPVCMRIICHAPVVLFGWIENKIYRFGDNATLQCSEGYEPIRETEAFCQADTMWSANLECIKVTCPRPTDIYHGTFRVEGFNYGELTHYGCNRGFVINGTVTRTCLANKTWSDKAPICERIDCGEPVKPQHGKFRLRATRYGSQAKYSCDEGYNLITAEFIRCKANGEWSENSPKCEIVKCDKLDEILPNKFYISSGHNFGDSVQYVCNEGYYLVGSSERDCGADGQWRGDIPDCSPVECPDPDPVEHGSFSGDVYTYGSFINYTCDFGFRLVGQEVLHCLANASWSYHSPRCEIIQCPDLEDPVHGHRIGSGNTFGSVLEFMCDFGYDLVGPPLRTCLVSARWSGNETFCEIVKCSIPNVIKYGHYSGTSYTYGSSIQYVCEENYDLFGPSRRTCQGDGKWTEMDPSCLPKRCPQPPVEKYARMQADGAFMVGSHVSFDCETGYNLVGQHTLKCKGDKWDAPFPQCAKVQCNSPKLSNGVMYEGRSFAYGDKLRLKCMAGYVLVGNEFCTCEADGKWIDTDAVCEPVSCSTPPYVNNTIVHSKEYVFGEYVFYQCKTGYEIAGNNLLQCNEMGDWVGNTPKCKMVSCGPPPVIHRATTTVTRYTYGSRTTYECNRGYILRGSDTLVCMGNKTWVPLDSALVDVTQVPRCDPVNCGAPPRIAHGAVYAEDYILAYIATYTCKIGYKMVGIGILQCGAEGYWNGSAPRCLKVSCDNPPLPANAAIVSANRGYDETTIYSCAQDYILQSGNMSLRCGTNGMWIGQPPFCTGENLCTLYCLILWIEVLASKPMATFWSNVMANNASRTLRSDHYTCVFHDLCIHYKIFF